MGSCFSKQVEEPSPSYPNVTVYDVRQQAPAPGSGQAYPVQLYMQPQYANIQYSQPYTLNQTQPVSQMYSQPSYGSTAYPTTYHAQITPRPPGPPHQQNLDPINNI